MNTHTKNMRLGNFAEYVRRAAIAKYVTEWPVFEKAIKKKVTPVSKANKDSKK